MSYAWWNTPLNSMFSPSFSVLLKSFIIVALRTARKSRSPWASTRCPVRYAALLRFCTNYAYRFSPADETVATRPPWLDSSLPRRPCRCISVYRSIILQTLNSSAIRSQGSTCALAVAAAYVPYVVAKLLQMMLLNYTCLNYASPNLRFTYTGMQACIDDTFWPFNHIIIYKHSSKVI